MEPLRDPNPSDLLEVREPAVVPQGLSRLSPTPRAGGISSSHPASVAGRLRWGIWPWDDALSPVWCHCRTWTTVSSPNGTQSWSWMRNEGKGWSNGGLEFQTYRGGSWGVTWSRGTGQGAAEMDTRNAAGGGMLSHH